MKPQRFQRKTVQEAVFGKPVQSKSDNGNVRQGLQF